MNPPVRRYLGETFGVDAGLYPALGPKRGEAMRWIVWSNVSFAEAVVRLMMASDSVKPSGDTHVIASDHWLRVLHTSPWRDHRNVSELCMPSVGSLCCQHA